MPKAYHEPLLCVPNDQTLTNTHFNFFPFYIHLNEMKKKKDATEQNTRKKNVIIKEFTNNNKPPYNTHYYT